MAKRTTSSRTPAKKTAAKKTAVKKTTKRTSANKRPKRDPADETSHASETNAAEPAQEPDKPLGAGDVVAKLLESPLMVDLIAVGATAALAAITEHRFSHRAGQSGKSGQAAKAAGKAAAAAIGRRIGVEIEEVLKAAKGAKGGGEA